jgi:hypothetical protein
MLFATEDGDDKIKQRRETRVRYYFKISFHQCTVPSFL